MRTYARVEIHNGYKYVTTVHDAGIYDQLCVWNDGVTTSHSMLTLLEMGYVSLDDFLTRCPNRKKFVFVEEG